MSDRTVRELGEDHRVAYQAFVDYAFDAASGPRSYDSDELPDQLGRQFGVFEAGDLRSVCTHHDLTASVRKNWLPLAGLAAVATPPEYRREGLVRTLVRDSLERWRGTYPLAALWPFEHAYYRQFGWSLANTAVEYACPPDALAFARRAGSGAGTLRRVDPDEWESLQDIHEAHGVDRGLTLRRDEAWWRRRVFRSLGGGKRYVYALEREEVDGYVAYTVGGGTLRVADLAFRDHDAYLALLAFLADHDSQVETVTLHGEDDSLLGLVDDPAAVDATVTAGAQVRVVDVERALSALSYPDVDATLRLAVADDHAPWNVGTFELRVADGSGECRRVDGSGAGGGSGAADATLGVGPLSQLVVGSRSALELARTGDLEASEATVEALTELLPQESVYLREYF